MSQDLQWAREQSYIYSARCEAVNAIEYDPARAPLLNSRGKCIGEQREWVALCAWRDDPSRQWRFSQVQLGTRSTTSVAHLGGNGV